MAKGSGSTRGGNSPRKTSPQTYEQRVDSALVGLRSDFFGKMDEFYQNSLERFEKKFADLQEKEAKIYRGESSLSATEYEQREKEAYGDDYNPRFPHFRRVQQLRDEYSDLTGGGYGAGSPAPNFYALMRGKNSISSARGAVAATAKKTAEKKFADVRAKMLKTTIEKGINPATARVEKADTDGFLITDGKVTLHARYILAWGEIKAPHFRFIITDRKS